MLLHRNSTMRFIQDRLDSDSESESTLKYWLRSRSRLRWKPYRLCPCQWAKFQLPTSFLHRSISIHSERCWLRSSVITKATVFIADPQKVIWGHLSSPTVFFFANSFWFRRDRDVTVVSLCFSHQDASIHMQYDLLGSPHDLDLMSNFDLDLSRSCYTGCAIKIYPSEKWRHLMTSFF